MRHLVRLALVLFQMSMAPNEADRLIKIVRRTRSAKQVFVRVVGHRASEYPTSSRQKRLELGQRPAAGLIREERGPLGRRIGVLHHTSKSTISGTWSLIVFHE